MAVFGVIFYAITQSSIINGNKTHQKTIMNSQDKNNQIIIYNTEDGETKIEVQVKDETVWLSQNKNSVTEEYSVTEK